MIPHPPSGNMRVKHKAIVDQDIKPLVKRIVAHDFQHTSIR